VPGRELWPGLENASVVLLRIENNGIRSIEESDYQGPDNDPVGLTFQYGGKPSGYPSLVERPIAFSLFTFVLNPRMGIEDLSLEDVRRIYVLNPSRYYDPGAPDNLARQVELCYEGIRGAYCDQVRQITEQTGEEVAWDDPRSPFKGSLREFRPGTFALSSGGPTTVYTDVYGRNVSTTPFEGSVEQYFSGSIDTMYVRSATRDYAADPADGIHAPN
jgi:hypothetical protein